MKCPNHLCQLAFDGEPAACPRCGISLPGAVLAGRFSLERIGRATPYSVTFVAFDRERTAEAQVRIYIPRFGRRAAGLKSEIKALKELQFGQLPRTFQLDWDGDFPWVAEEKVQATSAVGRLVGRERPWSEAEVGTIMLEAARILEKLHTLHIFHRDIRPETLLFREADSRLIFGTPGWEKEFHEKGSPRGRNIYAAPETAHGRATPQADLYSLGVTALHLLTGLNPEGLFDTATHTFRWQKAAKVSPRLAEIIDGLLAESPGDRIQTAGRLVQLLQALDRDPATEAKTGPSEPTPEPHARPAAADAPVGASGLAPRAGAVAVANRAHAPALARTAGDQAGAALTRAGAIPVGSPAAAGSTGRQATGLWGGLRRHRSAPGVERRRLDRRLVAVMAALGAMAGLVAATWRRLQASPFGELVGVHGAKVLVAIGLASGAAVLAHVMALPDAQDQENARLPARVAQLSQAPRLDAGRVGLPAVLIGYDDQAIPVAPDAGAISEARRSLPDPSLLSRWLSRSAPSGGSSDSADPRPGPAADPVTSAAGRPSGTGGPGARSPLEARGLAFDDGSRSEISRVLSLYSSVFPWQGRHVAPAALGHHAGRLSVAELLAGSLGLAPSLRDVSSSDRQNSELARQVPELPAPPEPGASEPRREDAVAAAPYDAAVEPGYDPADASGLSQPTSPYFIRVNKTYRTLTLYREGKFAAQYPITIGKGAATPDGRFTIANKVVKPAYEGIPGGDPRNPLGKFWLGLDVSYPGGRSIGLHGTNTPDALGEAESAGCIRLRNDDVERLYDLVPTGTPVEII